jgi:phage N-6-adenine-methyltransferase
MTNLGGEKNVAGTDVWLTPPWLLKQLGEFDLDPCAPLNRPWDTAKKHYTIEDNGLAFEWEGRVWLNPPYGRGMEIWLSRLAEHNGGGLALIFARTETKAFFNEVWDKADALLFFRGRIKFHTPDGLEAQTAQSPSVLIAYGKAEVEVLRYVSHLGKFIELAKG